MSAFKNAGTLDEEIVELVSECETIINRAKREDRELNAKEAARIDEIQGEDGTGGLLAAKEVEYKRLRAAENRSAQRIDEKLRDGTLKLPGTGVDPVTPSDKYSVVQDLKGRTAFEFSNRQKVADCATGDRSELANPIGSMMAAAITGRRGGLDRPILNVMSEGTDSAGGYTVPTSLSGQIIDKARAASAISRAGVRTFMTDSDNLTVAKVTGDATVETKAENAAFTGSDLTFAAVSFTPFLVGCYVTVSRELAEDGINFPAMLEDKLARALATGVDALALDGSGSGEVLGLLNDTGIGQTTTAGAVTWQIISGEVDTIRQNNYSPNAYILEPDIAHAVNETKDSQNRWLGPPPTLDGISQLATTDCASGEAIVGDFSQAAWCMRHGVRFEVSTEAGDAFAKHQMIVKMYLRFDFASLNDTAFRRISGLTAS